MVEYVEQKIGETCFDSDQHGGNNWFGAAAVCSISVQSMHCRKNLQMNSNVSADVSAKQNRHPEDACKSLKKMVGTAGFEPTTSCTPSKRATRLRHVPKAPGKTHIH